MQGSEENKNQKFGQVDRFRILLLVASVCLKKLPSYEFCTIKNHLKRWFVIVSALHIRLIIVIF